MEPLFRSPSMFYARWKENVGSSLEEHQRAWGEEKFTQLQGVTEAELNYSWEPRPLVFSPLWVLVTCYIPYLWENGFKYFFSCIRWQMTRLSHLFIIFSLLEICDGKLKEEHERKLCRVKCLPWRVKGILKFIPRSSRSSSQLLLATVFWEVICISSWLRLPVSQRSCAFTLLRYLNCWD